jgi:transcription elongation factor GreB
MSKAFTRESDDSPEIRTIKTATLTPPGFKNLMKTKGVKLLREKLSRLKVDSPTQSSRQRIREIQALLQSVVPVEPPPPPWIDVRFGARVTVRDEQKQEITYHLVGVDEANPEQDRISWCSPVAKALLKAKVGDRVNILGPDGSQQLEIIGLHY